ncbi:MAG: altronate dehydratase family protein [Bacteroidales bacterium]|jgi:altronate hydrolase|nr:altronate dehydratase family protein [Bacteroidales bacterium]MCI2145414.1 altronate dehydratase family protein [Bacteroidales bacterium]
MAEYIRIDGKDNVAVAVNRLSKGTSLNVDGRAVILAEDIPAGNKFALSDLPAGGTVVKYGFPIGHLTKAVPKGGLVDHNCLKTGLDGLLEYSYSPDLEEIPASEPRTFRGFERANGEVGIRNQIWIIPTVGCVNGTCLRLAELFNAEISGRAGSVDAVVAFPHDYGCSQLGDDFQNTRKVLRDMVLHPNAGGVLVVGLGCENNQLGEFMDFVGPVDASRIKAFETQKVDDEIEYGLAMLREIFIVVSSDRRTECPASDLRIGLKCGGSDGFSGISANPLVGRFSDWLVSQGGTTVLTEVPEMFGAETLLMNRCADKSVFDKTVSMINGFKKYFIGNGMPIYENPSPGNKEGGISTLEEKSLGCTQKSGRSIVRDVLEYGDRLKTKGLNLLSSPGNDLVAAGALASSGCQMVLFTTGRGTPFGTFVPTMKISTNTPLFEHKPGWMDFNAGRIIDGDSFDALLPQFIDKVLAAASGAPVRNEYNGFRELAIFKTGVTL